MACYTAVKINLGKIQNTLLIKSMKHKGVEKITIYFLARICMKKKKPVCEKDVKDLIKQVTQHDGQDAAVRTKRKRAGQAWIYFFILQIFKKLWLNITKFTI